MELTVLIQSLLGLVILLGILMFILLYSFKSKVPNKPKAKQTSSRVKDETNLEALRKIIRNSNSSTKELEQTLLLVLKYHGTIHTKLGARAHPDFDSYAEILFTIARHKNANKNIILSFDKELQRRNPNYKQEINEALMRGLNSRGV